VWVNRKEHTRQYIHNFIIKHLSLPTSYSPILNFNTKLLWEIRYTSWEIRFAYTWSVIMYLNFPPPPFWGAGFEGNGGFICIFAYLLICLGLYWMWRQVSLFKSVLLILKILMSVGDWVLIINLVFILVVGKEGFRFIYILQACYKQYIRKALWQHLSPTQRDLVFRQ